MAEVRLYLSMHTECTYKQPQHIMAPICLAIMSSGIKYVIVNDNTFGNKIFQGKIIKTYLSAAISVSIAKLSEEAKWKAQVIESECLDSVAQQYVIHAMRTTKVAQLANQFKSHTPSVLSTLSFLSNKCRSFVMV